MVDSVYAQFLTCGISFAQRSRIGGISPSLACGPLWPWRAHEKPHHVVNMNLGFFDAGQGNRSRARPCRHGTEPAGNGGAVASTGPWPAEAYAGDLTQSNHDPREHGGRRGIYLLRFQAITVHRVQEMAVTARFLPPRLVRWNSPAAASSRPGFRASSLVGPASRKGAAPRLVEYYDDDPCHSLPLPATSFLMSAMRSSESTRRKGDAFGVTVEATYSVGEYDIIILSARDSSVVQEHLRHHLPPPYTGLGISDASYRGASQRSRLGARGGSGGGTAHGCAGRRSSVTAGAAP
jgi:hypothetical protein